MIEPNKYERIYEKLRLDESYMYGENEWYLFNSIQIIMCVGKFTDPTIFQDLQGEKLIENYT